MSKMESLQVGQASIASSVEEVKVDIANLNERLDVQGQRMEYIADTMKKALMEVFSMKMETKQCLEDMEGDLAVLIGKGSECAPVVSYSPEVAQKENIAPLIVKSSQEVGLKGRLERSRSKERYEIDKDGFQHPRTKKQRKQRKR